MALIRSYIELTNKYSDDYGELTVILMQNGAFYEVYAMKLLQTDEIVGSKLIDFSRICDLNISERNMTLDGNPVLNAGFKTHLLEKYLKKLQDEGFTVVVYDEVGDDPVKKCKIREETGIYSPGTFFYTEDSSDKITNNICCLWVETKKIKNKKTQIFIGIGVIDIYTGTTTINEYSEDYIKNPTTFDDLERFISIHNPSETIVITNLETNDINDIVNFVNLKSKSIHFVSLLDNKTNKNVLRALNCEKQTYQTELLSKFYEIHDLNAFMAIFYENVYASQAFCFLLDFVYQHNPYLIKKVSQPIFENNGKKMILANHSLKQLNIIDDDNYKGKYSSVSKMLNECITPMGKRKFADLFLNPVTDISYLNREYDTVSSILASNYDVDYSILKNLLVKVKDICKIMRQIILEKATPKSIWKIYDTIDTAKQIYHFIKNHIEISEIFIPRIPTFVSLIEKIQAIVNYLDEVFYLEECKIIDNIAKISNSFIKNGVDSELDDKIMLLLNSQDQLEACRSYFSNLFVNQETSKRKPRTKSKNKKATQDDDDDDEDNEKSYVNIRETDKNNFSLCITDRRCKLLAEKIKDKSNVVLKYKSTYSGLETTFNLLLDLEYKYHSSNNKIILSNQITELCKNISTVKHSLIEMTTKVFQTIVKKIQDFQDDIEEISEFITTIDVLYCKATIAKKYSHCKPLIVESDKSYVKACELRHCLIEKLQQTELYVANDLNLGNSSDLDGILLYGTNAVGKTSFIRALGVAIIMAQAGLYVPATSFEYMPYKYIFTRILGNDNIFKGLSTFAVEMSELRTILRLADKNSLVLGDELCSGTESISAVSIFVAGVQHLANTECSFIFATHLHEIISYEEITKLKKVGMKHMSVIYDKENDCLVYNRKLMDGPGTNMYGLEVCKSLNLPASFLDSAHNIRAKYHPETNSLLEHKSSHFNAKHITGGICENCKVNQAVDVHHLLYQKDADIDGVIKKKGFTLRKNSKANLANLCQKCHDEIHLNNKKLKKTKTTKGLVLEEV